MKLSLLICSLLLKVTLFAQGPEYGHEVILFKTYNDYIDSTGINIGFMRKVHVYAFKFLGSDGYIFEKDKKEPNWWGFSCEGKLFRYWSKGTRYGPYKYHLVYHYSSGKNVEYYEAAAPHLKNIFTAKNVHTCPQYDQNGRPYYDFYKNVYYPAFSLNLESPLQYSKTGLKNLIYQGVKLQALYKALPMKRKMHCSIGDWRKIRALILREINK